MIAEQFQKAELSADQKQLLEEIWRKEESFHAETGDRSNELVAVDFVSFAENGDEISIGDDVIIPDKGTQQGEIQRLWGHFGSPTSCFLTYMQNDENEQGQICLALWIKRDGEWRKTFHHQNAEFV